MFNSFYLKKVMHQKRVFAQFVQFTRQDVHLLRAFSINRVAKNVFPGGNAMISNRLNNEFYTK
jgi:hypothetical protein